MAFIGGEFDVGGSDLGCVDGCAVGDVDRYVAFFGIDEVGFERCEV